MVLKKQDAQRIDKTTRTANAGIGGPADVEGGQDEDATSQDGGEEEDKSEADDNE